MRRLSMAALASFGLALTLVAGPVHASTVGSPAPALEPQEWLNDVGGVSWRTLQGRLILIEKWATW